MTMAEFRWTDSNLLGADGCSTGIEEVGLKLKLKKKKRDRRPGYIGYLSQAPAGPCSRWPCHNESPLIE
jgi:hypothetical protein